MLWQDPTAPRGPQIYAHISHYLAPPTDLSVPRFPDFIGPNRCLALHRSVPQTSYSGCLPNTATIIWTSPSLPLPVLFQTPVDSGVLHFCYPASLSSPVLANLPGLRQYHFPQNTRIFDFQHDGERLAKSSQNTPASNYGAVKIPQFLK